MEYQSSKMIPPPAPARIVPWRGLADCFRAARECRLALIVAFAGSGKTTYLRHLQLLADSDCRTAWLSLDVSDNDPSRFWTLFLDALDRLGLALSPDEGEGNRLRQIQTNEPGWLTEALGKIAAAPFEVCLFLDDYQKISTRAIHDKLLFWIEHMPSNMHVVIASRTTPPISLSRLRVCDQLVEIRPQDLLLDLSGTARFVRQIKGIDASDEEIRSLFDLIDGWIAGLQLAARARKDASDTPPPALVSSCAKRYIREYLIDEVFEQQEDSLKAFLLKTSILNRLSESLCKDIVGSTEKTYTLDSLACAGLFITPVDDAREWYCYHPCFAEALKNHLMTVMPEEVYGLYARASEWSERKGFIDDALEYALFSADEDRAIRLFEHSMLIAFDKINGEGFMLDGPGLQEWLDMLSTERYGENLSVLLLKAWGNFVGIHPHESMAYLNKTRQSLKSLQDSDEDEDHDLFRRIERLLAVIEVGIISMEEDYLQTIELSRTALTQLQEENIWLRLTLLCLLGEAQARIGSIDEALRTFAKARATSATFGGELLERFCSYKLGSLYFLRGQLQYAGDIWLKAASMSKGERKVVRYIVGISYANLVRLHIARGNIEEADRCFEQTYELLAQASNPFCRLEYQVTSAYFLEAQGNHAEALNLIAHAYEFARSKLSEVVPRSTAWDTFVCYARIALAAGDAVTADVALAILDEHLPPNDCYYQAQSDLIRAMILYESERFDEALFALSEVSSKIREVGYYGLAAEAMVLRAACLYRLGQIEAAEIEFLLAIEAVETTDFIHPFMSPIPVIEKLLYRILYERKGKRIISAKRRAVCTRILDARNKKWAGLRLGTMKTSASLSERERELYELLRQGLSKKEIAGHLHISINTVKTHVKNIYRKLDAHDRATVFETQP
jgi:LuxR family maltose regulon positive regulatory protein